MSQTISHFPMAILILEILKKGQKRGKQPLSDGDLVAIGKQGYYWLQKRGKCEPVFMQVSNGDSFSRIAIGE